MVKPHSTITGEIITVVNKTVSTVTPALMLFQQNKEISKELEKLRLFVQSLKNIQEMQVQQEEKEKGKEEETKKTKEEIKKIVKELENDTKKLIKDVQTQQKYFKNVSKLEFIESKKTADVNRHISDVERSLSHLQGLVSMASSTHGSSDTESEREARVTLIKGSLEEIKSGLNFEKRQGTKMVSPLNNFIQQHRKIVELSNGLMQKLEGVALAFKEQPDATTFVVDITRGYEEIQKFVSLLSQEAAPVERIGTIMRQRQELDKEVIAYIDSLIKDLKPEGPVHPSPETIITTLKKYQKEIEDTEGALVTLIKDEDQSLEKSRVQLGEFQNVLKEIKKLAVPSGFKRVLESLAMSHKVM